MTSVNEEYETFIQIPREFTLFNEPLANTGVFNANGDYSSGTTDFKIDITNDNTNIVRMIILISDTTLSALTYGAISTLANGIKIYYKKGSDTKVYINPDIPITTNSAWKLLTHDEIISSYGTGNPTVTYRFTFAKITNIVLNNEDEFGVELADDLSGLTLHYFNVQGYYDI